VLKQNSLVAGIPWLVDNWVLKQNFSSF